MFSFGSWVSFLFVWFLVVGFAIRYPFPEIRDEVPENLSGIGKIFTLGRGIRARVVSVRGPAASPASKGELTTDYPSARDDATRQGRIRRIFETQILKSVGLAPKAHK